MIGYIVHCINVPACFSEINIKLVVQYLHFISMTSKPGLINIFDSSFNSVVSRMIIILKYCSIVSDEEGVVANLQRLLKGAAKKRVMRPQPKLDVDR